MQEKFFSAQREHLGVRLSQRRLLDTHALQFLRRDLSDRSVAFAFKENADIAPTLNFRPCAPRLCENVY